LFKNAASEFVYTRTYSRWVEEENRREQWDETVARYIKFIEQSRGQLIPAKVLRKMQEAILSFNVMPSMRALWAAGPAADADNVTMFNCSFLVLDSPEAFAESLYILMCGCGQGFSVQQKYVNQLPSIPTIKAESPIKVTVDDSRAGWADSVKELIIRLYEGKDVEFDYSKLRAKGERLMTMGGRSSGPTPLITLHGFIREVFYNAQGRKLYTLECHDISNQIADTVVVGGVRRSSQISLSDLDDGMLRHAKDWPFPPRRAMANNSAVYEQKPTATQFLKEWASLAESGTGERGIFNLLSAQENSPKRRAKYLIAGTNPCGEISLRNKQFCNLSEIVVRADDDLDSLLEKVETATWIGAIQSTFTHFPYLSEDWKKNCEEERLLGVSITGQLDNPEVLTPDALKALKARAIKTAKHAAQKLNINMPSAVTCVKPSGTVSQLVDCSSGLHPRYAKYYIRRYRISAFDPLCKMMEDQGFVLTPENGQEKSKEVVTKVASFPIEAPKGCVTKSDMNAIDQLEWYKKIQTNWCEHNASATVYVKDDEWFEVGNWVYKNWGVINGVSFLPSDGGKYKQAPYEEIAKDEYKNLLAKTPTLDYTKLGEYEKEDGTEGAKSLACSGDRCEIT
jgi:ribonucleoside-diphosphate reductase alpha chain